MQDFGAALFSIIVIDLLLSGDNAVVIGMAARGLAEHQKRQALLLGGAGALILRVILTALTSLLLQIPLLQASGGLVLAWITYRLLLPGTESSRDDGPRELTFGAALRTIMIADLTMSLDNMLAVGAAARGNIILLLIGLTLSMGIILIGGTLVALLLEKLPWLVYVGAAILLIVAGDLLAKDPLVRPLIAAPEWASWGLAAILAGVVGAALWLRRMRRPAHPEADGVKSHLAP
ncbi:MAG TPA: YjbE family putative metal transport protein [Chloroflexia bacterium]|nr:YjbE family putative metal transport protein [Chloroflexia bacterium]